MLADARSRLDRIDAERPTARRCDGALLVDIRPAAQRAEEGEVHAAWAAGDRAQRPRVAPRPALGRAPEQASYDARVMVLCQEGYTSSLAADALCSLGLDATDVVGGFKAWREAHLPQACPAVAAT